MYFGQLLCAAPKVHAMCFDQLLGATHYTHFISNHDSILQGQGFSLVAHWLLVPGDNIQILVGEKNFPILFLSHNTMMAVYHGIKGEN